MIVDKHAHVLPRGVSDAETPSERLCRRERLGEMFQRAVRKEPLRTELERLLRRLGVKANEIVEQFLLYNEDVWAFGNEIYADIRTRFVLHIHNQVPGSWHIERRHTMIHMLGLYPLASVVDIGFGVPSGYVRPLLLGGCERIVLLDRYSSARLFAEALFDAWGLNWKGRIELGECDLTDIRSVPQCDAYILFDSIEHAEDPSASLAGLVAGAPQQSHFFLSIPVGPMIPCHSCEWASDQGVFDWLTSQGLRVISSKRIAPNPQVDVFVEGLTEPIHCVVVDAVKVMATRT